MKKKRMIRLVLLVLCAVIIAATVLTGCNFVTVNREREANQIMATVSITHEGQELKLQVTRNELVSYISYVINLYSQYSMSYDPKTLVVSALDSLVNQKYSILQGMVYLKSLAHRNGSLYMNTAEYKSLYGDKISAEGLLTVSERKSAIQTTNKSFNESIQSSIDSELKKQNEIEVTNRKTDIAALYSKGYTVKKDAMKVYHKVGEGKDATYEEGLYASNIVFKSTDSSSTASEIDYTKVYLKITFEKGTSEEVVYLPATESAVTTEGDPDAEFISLNITSKIVKVSYDEPTKDKDGNETYNNHVAEDKYLLVTPRNAYTEAEEKDERDHDVKMKDGDVFFRYAAGEELTAEEYVEKYNDSEIFKHTLASYESKEQERAYAEFRRGKKDMGIYFDAENTTDPYNTLGYYYISAFESAIITAVQHELKRAALDPTAGGTAITDAQINEEYKIKVLAQKEEYDRLSEMEQIKKFAETIKTDLSTAYYVPLTALLNQTYTYGENDDVYNYAQQLSGSAYVLNTVTGRLERDTGVALSDGEFNIDMFYIGHVLFKWDDVIKALIETQTLDQNDEMIRLIKIAFVDTITSDDFNLKTNPSNIDYPTTGGDTLADAFEVDEHGNIKVRNVVDVIAEMTQAMKDSSDPLETFKEYMTRYNDDSGSMSSALGYFIALGDIAHGYDGDDFPNRAKDLYLELLDAGNGVAGQAELSKYAFTSYGLHIEYITFAPFNGITLDQNSGIPVDFERDLNGTKASDTIRTDLETKVSDKAYSDWTGTFTADAVNQVSTKDEKLLKQLLKDYGL